MADAATLQARLAEAETALHQLMTGSKLVQVRYGDKDVRYSMADLGQLRAYIGELKSQLGLKPKRIVSKRILFG